MKVLYNTYEQRELADTVASSNLCLPRKPMDSIDLFVWELQYKHVWKTTRK